MTFTKEQKNVIFIFIIVVVLSIIFTLVLLPLIKKSRYANEQTNSGKTLCPKIGGDLWDTTLKRGCIEPIEKHNPIGALYFQTTHDGVKFT